MPGGVGGARASLASTRFGRGVSEKDRKAPRRGPTSADPSNANKRPTDTPRGQRQPRRSAAQPHGRSLPALELTTARYTRAYRSQHQERKFFPGRIFFALGLAVQHLR